MPQQTLLNFVSRTPKNKPSSESPPSSTSTVSVDRSQDSTPKRTGLTTKRRRDEAENSSSRKRIRVLSSESEADDEKEAVPSSLHSRFGSNRKCNAYEFSPQTSTSASIKSNAGSPITPKMKNKSKAVTKPTLTPIFGDGERRWTHLQLKWLNKDNIMDANKRRPADPEYDSRTLLVPKSFLDSLTPAMRQWWEMKAQNFDTILFFKVGKFYEFYHMDAVIAAQELGISFMKGEHAHCGIPELSFSNFAALLVEKGYKIARIEQTETPEMMQQRVKQIKATKFDKVVRREICQITTKGSKFHSILDLGRSYYDTESSYLYAICEKVSIMEATEFGICFVDTTIGNIYIGQFKDDRYISRLRTLLSHSTPAQILLQKGNLSNHTLQFVENLVDVRKEFLKPGKEFWSSEKTLRHLLEQNYYTTEGNKENSMPDTLKQVLCPSDSIGLTCKEEFDLAVRSLGAVVWYLKHCLLDHDILSLKTFSLYIPVDEQIASNNREVQSENMVLDSVTLKNLDVNHGPKSLLNVLDSCSSSFGKRLLKQWVNVPLTQISAIVQRQEAIEELIFSDSLISNVISFLKSLPDLERLLNKVHYLGSSHRWKDHPDGRAFFFDEKKYSKQKIIDFINLLKGFKTCVEIINLFKTALDERHCKATLLRSLVDDFPDLSNLLAYFDEAFDHSSAVKEGKIMPQKGVVEDFDASEEEIKLIKEESDRYLLSVTKILKCSAKYFGTDKNRFQVEIPDTVKAPNAFDLSSNRKGFKRYTNSVTKSFLQRMLKAEYRRETVIKDLTRQIFAKFDDQREKWSKALYAIQNLDVLISLSIFSKQELMCRPKFVSSACSYIAIEKGRHPCVRAESFIPNDTHMGYSHSDAGHGSFMLLTGPNMGGKSTLMRQVALITMLAHIGCYVPASSCQLSLIDRIFTRVGASDNITEGESTFYVEMSETSSILKHATPRSLVLMDELGRGTATYDGTGIAYAVAIELAAKGCLTLFSTHYHYLVESLGSVPNIQLAHMRCMVENENISDPSQESIIFLYKLASGSCPKSYGFNAAKLAGIPVEVVKLACHKAAEFERDEKKYRFFKQIMSALNKESESLEAVIRCFIESP